MTESYFQVISSLFLAIYIIGNFVSFHQLTGRPALIPCRVELKFIEFNLKESWMEEKYGFHFYQTSQTELLIRVLSVLWKWIL